MTVRFVVKREIRQSLFQRRQENIYIREECMKLYATSAATILQYNAYSQYGLFPTSSALCFAQAVDTIRQGAEEVILYNEYMGATPTVLRLQCVG